MCFWCSLHILIFVRKDMFIELEYHIKCVRVRVSEGDGGWWKDNNRHREMIQVSSMAGKDWRLEPDEKGCTKQEAQPSVSLWQDTLRWPSVPIKWPCCHAARNGTHRARSQWSQCCGPRVPPALVATLPAQQVWITAHNLSTFLGVYGKTGRLEDRLLRCATFLAGFKPARCLFLQVCITPHEGRPGAMTLKSN